MARANQEEYCRQRPLIEPLRSAELLGLILPGQSPYIAGGSRQPATIYTQDCLSVYFELKTVGVQFTSRLQYTLQGLEVVFKDGSGNCYKILEERAYESDE